MIITYITPPSPAQPPPLTWTQILEAEGVYAQHGCNDRCRLIVLRSRGVSMALYFDGEDGLDPADVSSWMNGKFYRTNEKVSFGVG